MCWSGLDLKGPPMIRAALTIDDARAGMRQLEPKIRRYAQLIVRKGVNVTPGQEVVVQAPVETCDFVRVLEQGGRHHGVK